MKTDKELLVMLLEAIDYSFYNPMERDYNKDLTYPVIDKVKYIKRVMQERPKFKIGDVVRNKENPFIVPTKIIAIRNNEYVGWGEKAFIPFDKQDKWELVEESPSVWHDAKVKPLDGKDVLLEFKSGRLHIITTYDGDDYCINAFWIKFSE